MTFSTNQLRRRRKRRGDPRRPLTFVLPAYKAPMVFHSLVRCRLPSTMRLHSHLRPYSHWGPYTSHFPLSIACSLASTSFPNIHVDPREKAVESRVIHLPTFNYLPCDQLNLLFHSGRIAIRVIPIHLRTGPRENLPS